MSAPDDEPMLGPPPPQPTEFMLEARSLAIALDAAGRADPAPVERRGFAARKATTEWSPIHLRRIREQPIAVYDPLGEIEITLDASGQISALDDPRHVPRGAEVHFTEQQAVARVAFLMGVAEKDVDLEAEVVRARDGLAHLRVRNRGLLSRDQEDKGKFFQKQEEAPKGPPPDRIDAELNAATGRIYRFRREPAPPPAEAPKK